MKNAITRGQFLTIVGGLTILPGIRRKSPQLSFSTLGCPDWTLDQIIDFAARNHYQGVEIRGVQRQLDLPLSPHFNSSEAISLTKRKFADRGIKIVALGSSCELHFADPAQREKNLDEGKRTLDLASRLGCPYVRVFPNKLPPDQDRTKTIELISQGLNALGDHAADSSVKVLMETHGDLTASDDILKVMTGVQSPNTGLVWDIANMWSVTKEPPAAVFNKIGKYVYHTHIKDALVSKGKYEHTFLGRGEVPIFDAIELLIRNKYKGFFSFEWEKLWNPEIAEPEIALADYPIAMQKHFR